MPRPKRDRISENHIYQAYGIYLLRPQHRLIRRLKRRYQPSVHGNKAWQASFLLMDYLQSKPIAKNTNVLEIGCGWGPGSVYCASRFQAKVTSLDIDREVFPFLDVLAEFNSVKVKPMVSKFENLKAKQLAEYPTIIGSDICFWDNMVKPLCQLINRAMKAGTQRFIITDPGRPTFREVVDTCSKKFKVKLQEWRAVEPKKLEGEVVEIRPK